MINIVCQIIRKVRKFYGDGSLSYFKVIVVCVCMIIPVEQLADDLLQTLRHCDCSDTYIIEECRKMSVELCSCIGQMQWSTSPTERSIYLRHALRVCAGIIPLLIHVTPKAVELMSTIHEQLLRQNQQYVSSPFDSHRRVSHPTLVASVIEND